MTEQMTMPKSSDEMRSALTVVKGELGVAEEPRGSNRGPRVEEYLASVGLGPGHAWCAAFVSWVLAQVEIAHLVSLPVPHSPWTPDFLQAPGCRLVEGRDVNVAPGMLFLLHYKRLGRVGHVGFIEGLDPKNPGCVLTIEGNSNDDGVREGYEVCRRSRRIRDLYAVISY